MAFSCIYVKNGRFETAPRWQQVKGVLGPLGALHYSAAVHWMPVYIEDLCSGHILDGSELKRLSAFFDAPVFGVSTFDEDALFVSYCDAAQGSVRNYQKNREYAVQNDAFPEFMFWICPPENRAALRALWAQACPLADEGDDGETGDGPEDEGDLAFSSGAMAEMLRLLGLPMVLDLYAELPGYERVAEEASDEGYVRWVAGQGPAAGPGPVAWRAPRALTPGAPRGLRLTQLLYPAGAAAMVEGQLDRFDADGLLWWNKYRHGLAYARQGRDLLSLCMATQAKLEEERRIYLKTPRACAVTVDEDRYWGYAAPLREYRENGGQPHAALQYLHTTDGLFLLSLEFTWDGKRLVHAEKTRMPGEGILTMPHAAAMWQYGDPQKSLRELTRCFGLVPERDEAAERAFLARWEQIWQDTQLDGDETVRQLSALLGFPLFFPAFPCEGARLVKSTQYVDRYLL